MRQKLLSISQNLKIPSLCTLCNQFHQGHLALCNFCIDLMTPLGPACQYCAHPLPDAHLLICGHCIKKRPHFDNAYIAYPFEEPLRGLLHQFKYHDGLYLTSFLCHLMMKALPIEAQQAQCLIPVPMHPKKIKTRGFNQAAVLVNKLSKQINLPCNLFACEKIKDTLPQASLNSNERRRNLKHAFQARPMPYKHVILIDDLLTTGSTANELARTLKKTGVARVDIWCCARTVYE